jgi:hypothetical protein
MELKYKVYELHNFRINIFRLFYVIACTKSMLDSTGECLKNGFETL